MQKFSKEIQNTASYLMNCNRRERRKLGKILGVGKIHGIDVKREVKKPNIIKRLLGM